MTPGALEAVSQSALGALCIYLFKLLLDEIRDRRKCDDEKHSQALALKDEAHTRILEANDRQSETFAKVGDAVVALTGQITELRAEVKAQRDRGGVS